MGGGHGDHGHAFKVPDWKIMKVEGIGPLEDIQNTLAAKGLKDPWLRNYVWRYPPEAPQNHFPRIVQNMTSGWKMGLGFFLVALSIKTTYQLLVPPKDHHGHGEHH